MMIQLTLREFAKLIRECEQNRGNHGCIYCALAWLCGESTIEESAEFKIVEE